MAAAARIHIVEKGKDPRAYAMVGFGGAGPAHAAEVARILGVKQVLIPPASGAASALGFLAAPLSFEQVRSHPVLLDAPGAAATIDAILRELTEAARSRLSGEAEVVTERLADMRLEGQMHEISVTLPDGRRSPTRRCPRSARRSPPPMRRDIRLCMLVSASWRSRSACAAAARCRGFRSPRPAPDPPERRRRERARPGSTAASSIHPSMTATPWRPARASPAPRSSRNARQPPSSRPATPSASMPPARWRSTSASPPRPSRVSPPTRRSNRPPR